MYVNARRDFPRYSLHLCDTDSLELDSSAKLFQRQYFILTIGGITEDHFGDNNCVIKQVSFCEARLEGNRRKRAKFSDGGWVIKIVTSRF